MLPDAAPGIGIITGSGLDSSTAFLSPVAEISFDKIPLLGGALVAGHSGTIVYGNHAKTGVMVFRGRHHWYEGRGWDPVAFPVYALKKFGARIVILVNAAGSLNSSLTTGSVMLINDHVNMMGDNPLRGDQIPEFGSRFPDMAGIYSRRLGVLAARSAAGARCALVSGIYLAVPGPAYETPAEAVVFRRLGADAIGMSTVPEAMLARSAGMEVMGFSCITNKSGAAGARHEEVLVAAARASKRICRILERLIPSMTALPRR